MQPLPGDDKKRTAYRALVHALLTGPGTATPEQRTRAFHNVDVAEPLRELLDKIAERPAQITDTDLAAANASGYSEDQIFELVICAAVGQATRQYEAGMTALAEASDAS